MKKLTKGIILIILCSFLGCSNNQEIKPYSYKFDFQKEVEELKSINPKVKRTAFLTNSEESFDTINWDWEFRFFLENDIHQPMYRGMFKEDIDTLNGKTIIVSYLPKEEDCKIRKVIYTLKGEEFQNISISVKDDNGLNYSEYELEYEPKKKYSINGLEGMSHSHETRFEIKGEIEMKQEVLYGTLDIGDEIIEFNLARLSEKGPYELRSTQETIPLNIVESHIDSIKLKFPAFDSYLLFHRTELMGHWANLAKGSNYKVPLHFVGKDSILSNIKIDLNYRQPLDFSGVWQATFSKNTEDEYPALGRFNQEGALVSGTFMTETGDYRCLYFISNSEMTFRY
jgi:hypothetical protein